jgi:hypothetical protein
MQGIPKAGLIPAPTGYPQLLAMLPSATALQLNNKQSTAAGPMQQQQLVQNTALGPIIPPVVPIGGSQIPGPVVHSLIDILPARVQGGVQYDGNHFESAFHSICYVCAAFDRVALEKVMMESFLQAFSLSEDEDIDCSLSKENDDLGLDAAAAAAMAETAWNTAAAAFNQTPAPSDTPPVQLSFQGTIEPCLAPNAQEDLFDSIYSSGGTYCTLFRQEIQVLHERHAEQIRAGKSFYDATVLVGVATANGQSKAEGAMYLANEGVMLQLLQPFVELATKQLQVLYHALSD